MSDELPCGVIHDVDETLRTLVRRDVLAGSKVEVAFEAPTKDWSSRRNAPTLNLYLFDIHEDLERREVQRLRVRDETGHVVSTQLPPRRFKLSYLVTAWTQRPEDEHRLLSAVLGCFLRFDALPDDVRHGDLVGYPYAIRSTIGLRVSANGSISDIWSALGGELKPSLELAITLPFETGRTWTAGPPVLEEPTLRMFESTEDDGEVAHRGAPADVRKRVPATKPKPGRRIVTREIDRP